MSGVGAAARKLIDWHKGLQILSQVQPELKKTVQDAVGKNVELNRLIREAQEQKPKLNWDNYTTALKSTDMSLLEECKAKASQFQPAPIDLNSQSQMVEEEAKKLMANADDFSKELELKIMRLETALAEFSNLKPVEELTINDLYERYPKWKEEFDERIKQDFWSFEHELKDYHAAMNEKRHH